MARYRFGDCEVDVDSRCVRVRGQRVALEPRAFDLLALAIQHRRQVVTRQLLIDQLWAGRKVSDAAIGRAILKVRRALGAFRWVLKTIPRIGVRFVAALESDTVGVHHRVAVLPFANETGEGDLDWLGGGLAEVLCFALQGAGIASMVSPAAVNIPAEAESPQAVDGRLRRVANETGATSILQGRLGRAEGSYVLDCHISSVDGPCGGFRVTGVDLPALVSRVSTRLTECLPVRGEAAAAFLPSFTDELAAESFARGLAAMSEEQWMGAAHLLRLAAELEPAQPGVRLALLRVLSRISVSAEEIDSLAQGLLAEPAARDIPYIGALVHQTMGRFYLGQRQPSNALEHLQLAMRGIDSSSRPDFTAQTLVWIGAAHYELRQLPQAEASAEQAGALCDQSGNRHLHLSVLMLDACLANFRGEMARQLEISVELARTAATLRAFDTASRAQHNIGIALAELGRLQEAESAAEEALARSVALRDPVLAGRCAEVICWIHRLSGNQEGSRHALEMVDALVQDMPRAESVWKAMGHHAMTAADFEQAAQHFQSALDSQGADADCASKGPALVGLIEALTMVGRLDEAESHLTYAEGCCNPRDMHFRVRLLHLRGLLEFCQGRPAEALRLLDDVIALNPPPVYSGWALLDGAWILDHQGQHAAAQNRRARVDPAMRGLQPSPLGRASRAKLVLPW